MGRAKVPFQGHICGFYYIAPDAAFNPNAERRRYLQLVDLSVHSTILASTSRTTLTQRFINPVTDASIPELRYTFPLYEGVSVVGFTCTINEDRVIRGLVKERAEARKTYDQAVARGETAGLLEQLPDASDVFTTTVGNVPAGAEIKVDITYLAELKHDAEGEGSIRFTIPTRIAPRYGDYPGQLMKGSNVAPKEGIKITVDAEMPAGSSIKSVQSPSHPISVTIGNTSSGAVSGTNMSLSKASATLSLASAELDKDFVLQVVAVDTGNPVALLETHPTLPNHRAIMTSLVPRFNLPSSRPEIVFVCDRSGSMESGQRIPHLKAALQIFLKSLPLGVKFNICSFGSSHELLFDKGSVSYDGSSVEKAMKYVGNFTANLGGTQMFQPLEDVMQKRYKDMDLEIFLLTDGEVWQQEDLITLVNKHVDESKGAIRIFTLGIGNDVSHALIEGVARAGNGFSQTVMDNEKMNTKVLRMLKAALTPHVKDYSLEIKYAAAVPSEESDDADFEIIEKVMDTLAIDTQGFKTEDTASTETAEKKTISLFDPTADPDVEMEDASKDTTAGGKYSGVPPIAEPKLLQAPFSIPPLYNLSRTSAYLLLSPESTQQKPTSVVLRGTSAHGPLELEIPITTLPEKAETIHQLAARKAIRELEDGRGWIFHAKDSGDGKLLRDKFPGRFPDMVEREAVRLGVKFQVGGKWCSFVAVEETADQSGGEPREDSISLGEEGPGGARRDAQREYRGAAPRGASLASHSQAWPVDVGYGRGGHGSGGFGGVAPSVTMSLGSVFHPTSYTAPAHPMGFNNYGAAPPPAPMGGGRYRARKIHTAGVAPRKQLASMAARRSAPSSTITPSSMAENDESDDDSDGDMGFGLYDAGDPLPAAGAGPKDPFEAVVALQNFEGSWQWSDNLFAALKMDADKIMQQAKSSSALQATLHSGSDSGAKCDQLATAVVLAWLETKVQDRKDEWEMMADKAHQWLESAMPGGKAGSYVTAVRDLVARLG